MTTGSPLGQLADLLRRVEAKTRAQELIEELELSADQLRQAEEAIREVEARDRQVRPARQRELEQAEGDEHLLKELVRRTAQNRALMGEQEFREAERLIQVSRAEIERRRAEAQAELETLRDELDRARIELRAALDRYHHVRRELDRLQVPSNGHVQQGDDLAQRAEEHFPEFQVRAFAREIEEANAAFAAMDRREQYAQMRVWIGRLRRFQHSDPGEDEREVLEKIFRRLVSLSKQHEPGYIEAFNRQYAADWDAYIAEAQESLRQASEEARRNREREADAPDGPDPRNAESIEARRISEQALEHLKALLLIRYDDPQVKADRFRETLARIVEGYGSPDERLLEVIRPYREWVTGAEFRSLREALDRDPSLPVEVEEPTDDSEAPTRA
ncbi:hypothetical protein [Tautonia sociabilis]|uniref:Uncharacterized protein n=1 Tax=Tautonia sociabilis TaxID=2080755 RepID=A0A432ME27_9BACT|nr:hypothetical protein [Tautonia sociabilis]RUL83406.1 hypothetical protein TsocGM_22095 [Tautonia sociabilis]